MLTQHHHWGIIEHGIRQQIFHTEFSDEYLYEFMSVEELLLRVIDENTVNKFLENKGGFLLTDEPNPLPKFHKITVWAYHADPKWLTWIALNTQT
jgi:hypothetical protein